jgi:hypothetical protein
MRSDNGKKTMVVRNMSEQRECCEERKGFEKICRGLIYAVG